MKVHLHIGTDKTGSTAIQKHLYVNRQWFLQRGVYVPVTGLGKDNGHGDLLDTMESEQMSRLRQELVQAATDGYGHVVISWEGMSFMDEADIAKLAAALPTQAPWLLVYLREQADIIQTGYLQEIKTQKGAFGIADFQGFRVTRSGLRALLYCYSPMRNYERLLRKWMTIVPRGQVIAREYRRDLLVNENIIDDFLARFGLCADDDFVRLEQATNISLDVESAVIMNRLDQQDSDLVPRRGKIFTLLSLIDSDGFGTRYFLSSRRVSAIRRYFKRSNRAVSALTDSPSQVLFAGSRPCVRTYTREEMQRDVNRRQQRFETLLQIPMLFTTRAPHGAPTRELLSTGWSDLEDWGAWSRGSVSEIRFRAPFWMTSHERASVIIFLKGRYRGRNTRSNVTVNGREYGWLDLRQFARTLSLPVSELHANQSAVVRIHHEFAEETETHSAAPAGTGTAFGIERFGIQFSNPE